MEKNEIKENSTTENKNQENANQDSSSKEEQKIIEDNKENKENFIKEGTKEEHESENDIKENDNKNKETKNETIDPHLIFQKELLNIIQKQEKILISTSTINEKFDISNEITKEQISSFKVNIDKYGKYLLMIKKELGIISDTMKKIKKLAKEKDNPAQK